MSPYLRLIPCLDVSNGRVVKGTRFLGLRDSGDPLELLRRYSEEGADEIVVLDISATVNGRRCLDGTLQSFIEEKSVPITVGGGIRTFDDAVRLFDSGADRVSLNSVLFDDLGLIERIAVRYGSQAVLAALDFRREENETWRCFRNAGRTDTGLDLMDMARACAGHGVGELILTSIDQDGTQSGYDLEAFASVHAAVQVPLIASGGAGTIDDLIRAIDVGATGVLIASRLHSRDWTIAGIATELESRGLKTRQRNWSRR